METDAIKYCIDYQGKQSVAYGGHGHDARIAEKQLTALVERIRVLDAEKSQARASECDLKKQCAALEAENAELKKYIQSELLRHLREEHGYDKEASK